MHYYILMYESPARTQRAAPPKPKPKPKPDVSYRELCPRQSKGVPDLILLRLAVLLFLGLRLEAHRLELRVEVGLQAR